MIENLNKLTVIKRDDFSIIKGIHVYRNKHTYYIIWHKSEAMFENFDTAKNIIDSDFQNSKKSWEKNNYKIFDIQFSLGKFAIRSGQGNRKNNRCYIRNITRISTCSKCNDLIDKDTSKHHGNDYYCQKCFDSLFVICSECNITVEKRSIKRGLHNELLCGNCLHDKYDICNHCGDLMEHENSYIGNDDNCYCNNCYHELFITCDNCEEIIMREDSIHDEHNDTNLCHNCHEQNAVIKHHGYKPTPIFTKEKYENTLFIGFELEVEAKDNNPYEVAEELQKLLKEQKINDRYYCKYDGSLSDGFEIVTHPTTLKSYHVKHKIREMLSFLTDTTTSQKNGRCGLHFHINKNFFTKNEINKLVYFFNRNREILTKFSKRKINQIHSYCNFSDFGMSDYIHYIKSRTQVYTHDHNRYVAVNLLNQNTVEIRLFRGTLNYKRFRANLQFIDAICHFVKEFSVMAMTWNNFLMYLRLTNRYNHLEQFLKKEKLVK